LAIVSFYWKGRPEPARTRRFNRCLRAFLQILDSFDAAEAVAAAGCQSAPFDVRWSGMPVEGDANSDAGGLPRSTLLIERAGFDNALRRRVCIMGACLCKTRRSCR